MNFDIQITLTLRFYRIGQKIVGTRLVRSACSDKTVLMAWTS